MKAKLLMISFLVVSDKYRALCSGQSEENPVSVTYLIIVIDNEARRPELYTFDSLGLFAIHAECPVCRLFTVQS